MGAQEPRETTSTETAGMEQFLSKMGAKDRLNVEKHLAACDAEGGPGHGRLWRRIAVALHKLAPYSAQTIGQHAVQFFIPDGKDGKYKMQVFALEDKRDGFLRVFLPDVLAEAVKQKILAKAPKGAGGEGPQGYLIVGTKGEMLEVESLDNSNTSDPPAHFKHMLGWNRKALRVSLPAVAANAQAAATEAMCAIAAKAWAHVAAPTAPAGRGPRGGSNGATAPAAPAAATPEKATKAAGARRSAARAAAR
jgi:hypothetical protein